jgi:hypothetical protein
MTEWTWLAHFRGTNHGRKPPRAAIGREVRGNILRGRVHFADIPIGRIRYISVDAHGFRWKY